MVVRGKKEPTDSVRFPADTKYTQKEKGPFLSSRWRYTRMATPWLLMLFVSSGADKLVDHETKNMKLQYYYLILRQIQAYDKIYHHYVLHYVHHFHNAMN